MRIGRTWILLGAGALLAAGAEAAAQDRIQGSGIRVKKDVGVTTTTTTTTTVVSGGDVVLTTFTLAAYNNMSEPMIAWHMATADSLEIQLAQLALTKATNQSVRNFANTLLNDHTAHLNLTVNEMIIDEGVGSTPMANDVEIMRMRETLSQLRNMAAGSSWDATFLRFQVTHHQNEIDIYRHVLKNAHDDDFEDHVENTIASLGRHRDLARSTATSLGITTP